MTTETSLRAPRADVPPARGGRPPSADWIAAAAALRAEPNVWVPLAENTLANVAGKIKNGTISAFRLPEGDPGHFDAVARELAAPEYRRGVIWAAYILEDPDALCVCGVSRSRHSVDGKGHHDFTAYLKEAQ